MSENQYELDAMRALAVESQWLQAMADRPIPAPGIQPTQLDLRALKMWNARMASLPHQPMGTVQVNKLEHHIERLRSGELSVIATRWKYNGISLSTHYPDVATFFNSDPDKKDTQDGFYFGDRFWAPGENALTVKH